MSSNVVVAYEKEMLTGLAAGQRFNCWIVCNSVQSSRALVRDLRTNKVDVAELSGDLYRVRKVRAERFTKATSR